MLTGSQSWTTYLEDGVRVFPCRCGETHRGDYAHEEWDHHNCIHRGEMCVIPLEPIGDGTDAQVMCMECGASWKAALFPTPEVLRGEHEPSDVAVNNAR